MKVKITQSCPTLCHPMDCIVHGILQARILEWVAFPFSRGSSQPRDQTQVSHIAGGFFLPDEPQGKPKNNGVGSLSLLQQIFLTQELNQHLLHCRQILYHLRLSGKPWFPLKRCPVLSHCQNSDSWRWGGSSDIGEEACLSAGVERSVLRTHIGVFKLTITWQSLPILLRYKNFNYCFPFLSAFLP